MIAPGWTVAAAWPNLRGMLALAVMLLLGPGLRQFLDAPGDWDQLALRRLLPPEAKVIGYEREADYALLAVAQEPGVRRFLLAVDRTLVAFDVGGTPLISDEPGVRRLTTLSKKQAGDELLLSVFTLDRDLTAQNIPGLDFAGVRVGNRVVLFYTERNMARSSASFQIPADDSDDSLRILVAGLAPGAWEIWRNGWLEEAVALVPPRCAVLSFEGRGGSYFLRHR